MQNNFFKLSAILILGIGVTGLRAQQTIPASGGNATGTGGTASYTVGQVVYTTNSSTSGSVSQGVQQPFEISVVTGLLEAKYITLQCLAYPNPTSDNILLKIEGELKSSYTAFLYDMNGKLLLDKKVESSETNISLKNFAPAAYYLKVLKAGDGSSLEEIKTFKIIKK